MAENQPMRPLEVEPLADDLRTVYQELCKSYQSIQDFRTNILRGLPLVASSSFAITLFSDPTKNKSLENLVLPFGVLGALVTLGFFFYELESHKRASLLAAQGRVLEETMKSAGTFTHYRHRLFNTRNAAGLVYSTSFSGWICLALWFRLPGLAIFVALLILIGSVVLSLSLLNRQRR